MTQPPKPGSQRFPQPVAVRLLGAVLSERDRDGVLGDLIEEYQARLARGAGPEARSWLRWQALHSVAPILVRRVFRALRRAMVPAESLALQTVGEDAGLFEKSLLEGFGTRAPRRRWWAVQAAVGLHLFVVAGLGVARVWTLEDLPAPVVQEQYIPVSLGPPPPPPQQGRTQIRAHRPRPFRPFRPAMAVQQPVVVPPTIPEPAPIEPAVAPDDFDLPEMAFDGPGDPRGDSGGVPEGIPGGQGTGPGTIPEHPVTVQGDVRPPGVDPPRRADLSVHGHQGPHLRSRGDPGHHRQAGERRRRSRCRRSGVRPARIRSASRPTMEMAASDLEWPTGHRLFHGPGDLHAAFLGRGREDLQHACTLAALPLPVCCRPAASDAPRRRRERTLPGVPGRRVLIAVADGPSSRPAGASGRPRRRRPECRPT